MISFGVSACFCAAGVCFRALISFRAFRGLRLFLAKPTQLDSEFLTGERALGKGARFGASGLRVSAGGG